MIRYARDESNEEQVLVHLRACSASFVPPLETRVDLVAYAAKMASKARRFEAWRDDVLVGLVAAYFNGVEKNCFITNVSVLPSHHRQGLAQSLVAECLSAASGSGLLEARLEVGRDNVGAQRLYEALGFSAVESATEHLEMRRHLSIDA